MTNKPNSSEQSHDNQPNLTGGADLIRSLHKEGVRVIFGLPGVQLYHAVMPLLDYPDIQFITTRHEQATTYMADGYARASGGIGVSMIVPGPGLQNASAGITNAYAASSRVLVICGQIERDKIGKDVGVLHEINDQLDVIKPITKWQSRILAAKDVATTVQAAFYQLRTGRPRPVEIEVPPEALSETTPALAYSVPAITPPTVDGEAIEEAAALINEARTPIIWAGGGIHSSEASEILLRFAEYLQIPILTTPEGKGAISDRHYLSLGTPQGRSTGESKDPLRDFFYTSDLVLALGTRFATANPTADQKVLQIDIDSAELGRNHDNTFGIEGDVREVLTKLLEAIQTVSAPRDSKRSQLEALRNSRYNDPQNQVEPQHAYIQALRSNIPDDAILVTDMTIMAYYSRVHFATYQPRSYFTSSYSGNLGSAFPTALGVKVAQPTKVVVSLSGDGGFLFNSQELATAAQFGINVIAVVFNDGAYGNVKRDMKTLFDGKSVGVELSNPDFMKLADAYGLAGIQARSPEEFADALRKATTLNAPVLLEVLVTEMPSPF